MDLSELKENVDNAINHAKELKINPAKIKITLQIDGIGVSKSKSIWSTDNVEFHYDNDCNASDAVVVVVATTKIL